MSEITYFFVRNSEDFNAIKNLIGKRTINLNSLTVILWDNSFENFFIDNDINYLFFGNYAKKIISTAESVFFQGEPSRVTINAYLPSGVQEIKVEGKNLIFNVSTSSGFQFFLYESRVSLEGNLTKTEGVKKIQIIALEDKVRLIEG